MSEPSKYCEELLHQQRTGIPHKSLLPNGYGGQCPKQPKIPPIGDSTDFRARRNISPCSRCIAQQWDSLKASYSYVPTDGTIDYYRISLIGDGGVGKSSLSKKYCWEYFYDEGCQVDSITSKSKRVVIDGQMSELKLYIPTLQEFTSYGVASMPVTECAILVYDITLQSSFRSVVDMCSNIRQHKNDQGLYGIPICILGNKCDKEHERQVLTEQARGTATKLGCYFAEVSAKTGEHVSDAFEEFARVMQNCYPQTFRNNQSKSYKQRVLYPPTKESMSKPMNGKEATKQYVKTVQLIRAAQDKRTIKVMWLLTRGTRPNHQSWLDDSALYAAAAKGHKRIVRLLLDYGAAINAKVQAGMTPLQIAVINNHISVVRLLIDRGSLLEELTPRYGNALHAAATLGRLEIARLLLRSFANVNAYGGTFGTPLLAAIATGNLEMTRLLLDWDAWVYLRGEGSNTPLEVAAYNGNVEIVRLLLDRGANISSIPSIIGSMGFDVKEDDNALRFERILFPHPGNQAVLEMVREAAQARQYKLAYPGHKCRCFPTSSAIDQQSIPPPPYSAPPSRSASEATIVIPKAHHLDLMEEGADSKPAETYVRTSSTEQRCLCVSRKGMMRKIHLPFSSQGKKNADHSSRRPSLLTIAVSDTSHRQVLAKQQKHDEYEQNDQLLRSKRRQALPQGQRRYWLNWHEDWGFAQYYRT
ncbi:MAG: hypothetical protein M1836_002484 [Candelina mexicana]|nr:MAG: hypothetical protein M1836_002484 [Candelina mexicana]